MVKDDITEALKAVLAAIDTSLDDKEVVGEEVERFILLGNALAKAL